MAEWTLPFDARTTADGVLAGLDLRGKTVLVTGANTGIGFETARALAAAGAHVVLGCRDRERGTRATLQIQRAHADAAAELSLLDLASLEQVRDFARGLTLDRLDAVVCNAGLYSARYAETADGFERTVGVCHVGHFLLVQELLERLLAAGRPRVVMVSSESHRSPARLDFDRLPLSQGNYRPLVAYGQAKLCNVLHAKELQRRYGARGLSAYALHPGTLIATHIARGSLLARALFTLARPFTRSLAQGAATSVMCAAHPDVEAHAGGYFSECAPRDGSPESNDPEVARRLWEVTQGWLDGRFGSG